MIDQQQTITLLGSAGGAVKAILSILNQAAVDKKDPIYRFISRCKIHLVDYKQKEQAYFFG